MNNLLLAQAIFVATSFIITQSTTSSEDTRVAWGDNSVGVSQKDKSQWIIDIPNSPKKDGIKTAETEVSNSPEMQNGLLPNGVVMGFCAEGVEGQNASIWVDHLAKRGGVNMGEADGSYIYYCVPDMEEVSAEPIVISVSAKDFQRLPLRGSGIVLEPDRDDYIIRLPVIALTDPSPQILTTTILGVGVAIRATPIEYSWDFGDQTPALITTDPGRSYPDQTVEHLYTQLGQFTITLTTTWEGEFSIDGGTTWLPINGTTTTTNTTNPITIEERVPLLTG